MFGFKIKIKGDYALFSRPEMKVERVSYDVPTPSALVGLISAIFWHPGVKYVIDKIYVYRQPDLVNIRRNELSEKISLASVKKQMNGGGGRIRHLAGAAHAARELAAERRRIRRGISFCFDGRAG